MNYVSFTERDLGGGIDALSSESSIPEGFSERLVNVDPTPEGYLSKRVGYSSRAGWVPVRVNSMELVAGVGAEPDMHCFYLDAGIDVTTIDLSIARSSPLVVYGKLAADPGQGDFSDINSQQYYKGFSPEARNIFATGTHTNTLSGAAHAQGNLVFVGLGQSDSQLSNNNTNVHPDTWEVDKSTADVAVTFTNNGSDFDGFIYVSSGAPAPGLTYVDLEPGPATTISIPAAVHQLANTNILHAFYEDTGTSYVKVFPETVSVTSAGDFSATFSAAQTNLVTIIKAAPILNTVLDTVAPGTTFTKSFPVTQPFLIYSAYEENLLTGERTLAVFDSLSVADGIASLSYTNLSSSALNFVFYYEYGILATNKLCVEANNQNISSSQLVEDVQLTIWGLNHAEIYSNQVADLRAGWVTHIDNYRAEGTEKLITGLGGNLFEESADVLPAQTLYPRLRSRIGQTRIIGPAFAEISSRTRGYISFAGAANHYAKAVAATWDAGVGMVRYDLSMPALTINGLLSEIIHTTLTHPNMEDYVEITQSANPEHSGLFRIANVVAGVDTLSLWVENPLVGTGDFDETDSGMFVGIFSDKLELLDVNPFLPGDLLSSDLFSAAVQFQVTDMEDLWINISGVDTELSVPVGLRVAGSRVSSVIPLRAADDEVTVEGFVRGDVITYSPIERRPQITRINPSDDTPVSIVGDGTVALISLSLGGTEGIYLGQKILLSNAGPYTGEHVVVDVPSPSSLSINSPLSLSKSGILIGATIEINETLPFADSQINENSISVDSRWTPIESPEDQFDSTPATYRTYFNAGAYVNKPTIRSSMSNDTMFFTNGQDEVLKYDSENVYRAGLPTWQMQLFTSVDTTTPLIPVNLPSAAATAYASGSYTVALGAELAFVEGDLVTIGTATQGTVTKIYDNGTSGFIQIRAAAALPAAPATITLVGRYRYYFRLNMIDLNDNLIASTVVGSADTVVELSQSAAIKLRLVGLPVLGPYNYSRIEAEIYRTKLGTVAPFYRIATIPLSFNEAEGYVDFTDTLADDTLVDLDAVSTALEGAELGNGWSQPLRASYVTSAAGSLVLGDIKDYPKLTMRIVDKGLPVSSAQLVGKRFLFRKDNTDTITITDNINSAAFEFVNTGAVISSSSYSGAGQVIVAAPGTYTAGDWVYLYFAAQAPANDLSLSGWYMVEIGGTGSFVVQTGLSALPANTADRVARATLPADVPVFLGVDGNYSQKDFNTETSTYALLNATRRFANAINATQRVCSVPGFTTWLSARAGAEFAVGELVIEQPLVVGTTLELVLPAFNADFLIFVNGVKREDLTQVSSLTALFPSRVIVSYPNFPELFNRPTSAAGTVSQVYDVNPADGQKVTGLIPFFGESAFGASAKGAIVVVFKTNSIYLLDLSGNTIDGSRIQKVDSRGIGCTAPFSIAPTQNGIMFASDSGIYRLKQDLTVEYIGRKLERIWQKEVRTDDVGRDIMTGHYSPTANCYKLSSPLDDDSANNTAFVYNTVREYSADGYRAGSWTIYDQIPACGWANNTSDSFFGSSSGDVMLVSSRRSERPYRDNGSPINATATLRALDFGEPSIRKAVGSAILGFRTSEELTPDSGTIVLSSIDLKDQFQPADLATVSRRDTLNDGLGSSGVVKVRPIKYTFDRRKGTYFQLQIQNAELDSPMDITSISLRVAGLTDKGQVEAKSSK